jgi:PAS domain S-box-containing protein
VKRIESLSEEVLVLGGLVLAGVIGAFAVTTGRRTRATREFERYFTLSPEMVIVAGFDGYWKRVNPTVEAVLGYSEREALARPFMEFVHPDDRERTEEEARRVVAGAMALAFENRIVCKDGSHKWIEWTVTPVAEESVMHGIGRDVTERRRSESEQAALQRIATLVAQDGRGRTRAAPGHRRDPNASLRRREHRGRGRELGPSRRAPARLAPPAGRRLGRTASPPDWANGTDR